MISILYHMAKPSHFSLQRYKKNFDSCILWLTFNKKNFRLLVSAPFQQIGEQHLLYTQSHIYWLVVNMVLDGVAFYVGCGPKHVVVILFHHFAGLDLMVIRQ